MSFKIGFSVESNEETLCRCCEGLQTVAARKSVVKVRYPSKNLTLSYYNDEFDLRVGDLVFVEGKLEGVRGVVVEVNYGFKIKLSDYKRVVSVVDASVHGRFCFAGSHLVTFDRNALPKENAVGWFKAPSDEEFVCGSDETSFLLEDLQGMGVSPAIAERGYEYYSKNLVRYVCVDGNRGYAVVEGGRIYEVEFEYCNGEIRNLTCTCFCDCNCKHEFAAMLQLRETLEFITKHYSHEYDGVGYFAAIYKGSFFSVAIDGNEVGSISL